jgi:hypothetical protein
LVAVVLGCGSGILRRNQASKDETNKDGLHYLKGKWVSCVKKIEQMQVLAVDADETGLQ